MKQLFILSITLFSLFLNFNIQAQKIDYSESSNFINPDTLRGDYKKVFWHFVDLSYNEVKDLKPITVKQKFGELGIRKEEKQRFINAYFFLVNDIEAHKKSCEQWENFKDLKPKM